MTETLLLCPIFSLNRAEDGNDEITLANFPNNSFVLSEIEMVDDDLKVEISFLKESVSDDKKSCFLTEVENLILFGLEEMCEKKVDTELV